MLRNWKIVAISHSDNAGTEPGLYRAIPIPGGKTDVRFHITKFDINRAVEPQYRLLFVHGMEYHSPSEVVADMVEPYVKHGIAHECRDFSKTEFLFYYWPSCISSDHTGVRRSRSLTGSLLYKVLSATSTDWPSRYAVRVKRAARNLEDALNSSELLATFHGTTVVTHSLGASVWALAAQSLLNGRGNLDLGDWISLQPAVDADAFCEGGVFSEVADHYARNGRCIAVLYSRFDLVLKSFDRLATGSTAMGEVGAYGPHIHSVDVTNIVGEAHGKFRLLPASGCFFNRASLLLQQVFRELRSRQLTQSIVL